MRNHIMLSPIHSIPAETVSYIFRYTIEAEEEQEDENDSAKKAPRREKLPLALRLRSVCSRWRIVAGNTPELWPDLVGPHGLEWTRRALAWSKNCSLDLYLRDGSHCPRRVKDWDEAIPCIITGIHRARVLYMSFDAPSTGLQLLRQALSSSSLPRLEALTIVGGFANVHLLDTDSFASEAPRQLCYVSLHSITLPATCRIFQPSLTTLLIGDCTIWTSIDALLDTLSGLPLLETFSMSVYPQPSNGPFEALALSATTMSSLTMNAVDLPHLELIQLRTQVEFATYLFARISFPTSCSIIVDMDVDNIEFENLAHLYPALDRAFGAKLRAAFPEDDQSAGFRVLSLDVFQQCFEEGVTIRCEKPTLNSDGPSLFHLAFLLGSQLPELQGFDTLSAIAYYMLENWPATRRAASQLCVSHPTLFRPDLAPDHADTLPWVQVLRLLDTVEHIVLDETFQDIFEAFADLSETLLPRLRHIEIDGARLSSDDHSDLIFNLSIRMDGGRSTLKLRNCTLDGRDISSMDVSVKDRHVHTNIVV